MKLLNELALTLENPNWAVNTEFAVFDTILTMHPEIIEIVASDFGSKESKQLGGRMCRRASKSCEARSTRR